MTEKAPDFRNPLARVRALGSAKEGVHHWKAERLSALALVFLGLWFMAAWLCPHDITSYQGARAWLARPIAAALMILTLGTASYHGALGLQVVVEDYVHGKAAKFTLLTAIRFAATLLALIGILSVLKIAVGGI